MKDFDRDSFERLERLEDLTREIDDHYWKLGTGLNDNQDNGDYDHDNDNDNNYSHDNEDVQDTETTIPGRHI